MPNPVKIGWYIACDDFAHAADSLRLGGKELLCDEPGHPPWVGLAPATTQPRCERCISVIAENMKFHWKV